MSHDQRCYLARYSLLDVRITWYEQMSKYLSNVWILLSTCNHEVKNKNIQLVLILRTDILMETYRCNFKSTVCPSKVSESDPLAEKLDINIMSMSSILQVQILVGSTKVSRNKDGLHLATTFDLHSRQNIKQQTFLPSQETFLWKTKRESCSVCSVRSKYHVSASHWGYFYFTNLFSPRVRRQHCLSWLDYSSKTITVVLSKISHRQMAFDKKIQSNRYGRVIRKR